MQVRMTIIYESDTDQVAVGGPTEDIGLCHLILDLARQSLLGSTMQQIKARRIVAPGLVALPTPPKPS